MLGTSAPPGGTAVADLDSTVVSDEDSVPVVGAEEPAVSLDADSTLVDCADAAVATTSGRGPEAREEVPAFALT